MRSLDDLRYILSRPGTHVCMSSIIAGGEPQQINPVSATPTLVGQVYEDRVFLADGRFIPFHCLGEFSFQGDRDDEFVVQIGPATITYQIGQGRPH